MGEPEPFVPKPRQDTGHLSAPHTVTGSKHELMNRSVFEVPRRRSGRADSTAAAAAADGSGGDDDDDDDDIRAGSPSVPFPSARPVRGSALSHLLRK